MAEGQLENMPHSYWENRWADGDAGWHKQHVDGLLQKYLHLLTSGRANISILVTLCGKSLDLPWLCEQGHDVVGVELSRIAAVQLFQENNIPYSVSDLDDFSVFSATDRSLKLFIGDVFKLTVSLTGSFDAIWDSNAIVAINASDRAAYAKKLLSFLKPDGKMLMATWQYNQAEHSRHPFSIPSPTIRELFQGSFDIEQLETIDMTGTYFTKKFNLTFANRIVHILSRKLKP